MPNGYLSLVMHAHLPYVRHPEHEFFLEENWLYEATLDCYIPLVRMLGQLAREGVEFGLGLSLSPTLLEMLSDQLLQSRFRRHAERLISLCRKEESRLKNDPQLYPVIREYSQRYRESLDYYDNAIGGDLVEAVRELGGTGKVELMTTAATHAFLPNLMPVPEAVAAQVEAGMRVFEAHMHKRPRGFWLPECGYAPGIDSALRASGVEFFFLETHGLLHAQPRVKYGLHRPVRVPAGLVAFGRDPLAAERVWCAERGYPADPMYRDFFSDVGFEASHLHVRQHLGPMVSEGGAFTGLKYKRITSRQTADKAPYDHGAARARAESHALKFVADMGEHVSGIKERYGFRPIVTAPYDAELFGHWWFEGIEWLERVLRGCGADRRLETLTPSALIERSKGKLEQASPPLSSWGEGGYSMPWSAPDSGLTASRLIQAGRVMLKVARASGKDRALGRAKDQAMRELMLASASDWMFMLGKGSHPGYARQRIEGHLEAFHELAQMANKGRVDNKRLDEIEAAAPLMRGIGSKLYSKS